MVNFAHLKGGKTGFSVVTFSWKIITYSPERFLNESLFVMGSEKRGHFAYIFKSHFLT